MEDAVTLSALGIVATVAAALVWLLKKQFTQNDTTIKESTKAINKLADVMEKFSDALSVDEIAREKFQDEVTASMRDISSVLKKISSHQDSIKVTVEDTNSKVTNHARSK